jgi:hypothetical protein
MQKQEITTVTLGDQEKRDALLNYVKSVLGYDTDFWDDVAIEMIFTGDRVEVRILKQPEIVPVKVELKFTADANAADDLPYINFALGARVQYGVDKFGYVIEQLDNSCYTIKTDDGERLVAHISALELAPKVDEYIPPPPAPARKPMSSRLENDEAGPFDNKAPQYPQGSRVRVLDAANAQGYDLATVSWNNQDDTQIGIKYDTGEDGLIYAPYHGQVEQASDGE